jgi:hypothetical protein
MRFATFTQATSSSTPDNRACRACRARRTRDRVMPRVSPQKDFFKRLSIRKQ